MNYIKTALKYIYHQRWLLLYSDFLLKSTRGYAQKCMRTHRWPLRPCFFLCGLSQMSTRKNWKTSTYDGDCDNEEIAE